MQKSPDQQCKMQEIAYKRAKGCVTLFYFFVHYTVNNKAKIIPVIGGGESVTEDMKKKLKGDTNE